MWYVYRFLDKTNNIVYIGKTNNIKRRMNVHFSSYGHLKENQYKQVEKIEYVELAHRLDMNLLEKYLINFWKPSFNNIDSTSEITLFDFDINLLNWKLFDKKILKSYNNCSAFSKISFIEKNNSLTNSCNSLKELNKLKISSKLINILLQSNLSLNEHKFLNMLISQINEKNIETLCIKLSINQIKELCCLSPKNLRRNILNIFKKLSNNNFWIIKEKGTQKSFSWLESIKYIDGVYVIKISNDLKSFLLDMKENYIQKELKDIQIYKNEYALKLDMLFSININKLNKNEFNKKVKFNYRKIKS